MSKKRTLAAAFAALAFSLLFVAGALAQPAGRHFTVTKEADPATLPAGGGEVTYTITVTNDGTQSFHGLSLSDDKCTLDNDGSDVDGGNQFKEGDEYVATCTVDLTAATTNTVTVKGCTDGSVESCNQEDHFFEASDSASVTVGTTTATIDMTGTSAAMLALILLAIGGIGFLGTTNRLPKLPKFR